MWRSKKVFGMKSSAAPAAFSAGTIYLWLHFLIGSQARAKKSQLIVVRRCIVLYLLDVSIICVDVRITVRAPESGAHQSGTFIKDPHDPLHNNPI